MRFRTRELRPACREGTLSTAIRKGIDPNGRAFSPVMPKYTLSNQDMATLIHYLEELSSRPSPGATETSIALATVITDDVAQADRGCHARVSGWECPGAQLSWGCSWGYAPDALDGDHVSELSMVDTGPLGSYGSTQHLACPVGGLLPRGASLRVGRRHFKRLWKPIHQFCEDHQIPCILPITDLPQISPTDYYTVYFTKGYYQEGEAVARYLGKTLDSTRPWNFVQVLGSGPAAKALAAGFENAWASDSGKPVQTISLEVGQSLTTESLLRLIPAGKDSVLLLWTGPESSGAMSSLAASPNRPAIVFLSSTVLGGRLWDLPLDARLFTYFSYPYREPGPKTLAPKVAGQRPIVVNKEYRANDRRIASKTGTAVALLTDALTRMEQNFYRDHLLDQIDMTQAQEQRITNF